jgi:hypothetical protein
MLVAIYLIFTKQGQYYMSKYIGLDVTPKGIDKKGKEYSGGFQEPNMGRA